VGLRPREKERVIKMTVISDVEGVLSGGPLSRVDFFRKMAIFGHKDDTVKKALRRCTGASSYDKMFSLPDNYFEEKAARKKKSEHKAKKVGKLCGRRNRSFVLPDIQKTLCVVLLNSNGDIEMLSNLELQESTLYDEPELWKNYFKAVKKLAENEIKRADDIIDVF